MARIKTRARVLMIAAVLAVTYFGLQASGILPTLRFKKAMTMKSTTQMPSGIVRGDQTSPTDVKLVLPSATPVAGNVRYAKVEIIPWNAQLGFILANGGFRTTRGSLMEKWGLKNLEIVKQTNCNTMKANLLHSAQVMASGGTPDIVGCTVMGDYTATFITPLNDQLKKFGDRAIVVYSFGRSYGEDKYMDQPAVRLDPQKARGSVLLGVGGDGDVNIALNYADANQIPVNPDLGTYDPDAINIVNYSDFTDAYKTWVSGQKVTLTNKKTGKPEEYQPTGLCTWTPGDEIAVSGRGGLVTIASTFDYPNQMPNAFIVLESWARKNADMVVGMACASSEAADQINAYPQALQKAGEISAQIYGERDGQYWASLYNGYDLTDRQGNVVKVGGSMVHNMADNIALFGIEGGINIFETATYKRHGEFIVKLWPDMLDRVPPFSSCFDPTYLRQASAKLKARSKAIYRPDFTNVQVGAGTVMSRADWAVEFRTGSASLTPEAQIKMQEIMIQLATMSNVTVEIHGHTDDVGDASLNTDLSRMRAYAVKAWLEQRDQSNFGPGRIHAMWHGEEQPKINDTSESARAQNRRVEIITRRVGS